MLSSNFLRSLRPVRIQTPLSKASSLLFNDFCFTSSLLKSSKSFKNLCIHQSLFRYSSLQTLYHNDYKQDLMLLNDLSREQLTACHDVLDKYTNWRDLTRLTSLEIEALLTILSRLGFLHKAEGNLDKAYWYLLEEQDLSKRLGIADTFPVAQNHYILASIYLQKGELSKAEDYLKEVDSICRLLGDVVEAKALMIQGWSMLGSVYARKNEEEKALEFFNSVLASVHNETPEATLANLLINTYQEMGQIYTTKSDFEKANEFWIKAHGVTVNQFGESSKEAFHFCTNLAKYLYEKDKSTEALTYAQKGLQLALDIYSKNSAEAALAYRLLGGIYLMKVNENFTKALESCKKAAKVYQKLGKNYLNALGETYIVMAKIHQTVEDFEEATYYFSKGIEAYKVASNGEDLNVAEIYIEWAHMLQGYRETISESELYLRKALDIYKHQEPSNKLKIADIIRFLGDVADYKGDVYKALQLWKESEKLLEESSVGPMRFEVARTALGTMYLYLKNYDESLKYLQKVVEVCETVGPSNVKMLGMIYFSLGRAYEEKGRVAKALEAFGKAAELNEIHLGQEDPKTLAAVMKIEDLLRKIQRFYCERGETKIDDLGGKC